MRKTDNDNQANLPDCWRTAVDWAEARNVKRTIDKPRWHPDATSKEYTYRLKGPMVRVDAEVRSQDKGGPWVGMMLVYVNDIGPVHDYRVRAESFDAAAAMIEQRETEIEQVLIKLLESL
jgi:hypothetical protein